MTFGEGKDKVYMLLDEYAEEAVDRDEDIEAKMAYFFDIAQKNLANIRRIIRVTEISREEGKELYDMPEDFASVYRIWQDGKARTSRFDWIAGKLRLPEEAKTVQVEYFAIPKTIRSDTPEDEEFEIKDDAAQCMPFFVAAQQLVTDLVVDYQKLLALYDRMVAALPADIPGQGTGQARQTFYRGWR